MSQSGCGLLLTIHTLEKKRRKKKNISSRRIIQALYTFKYNQLFKLYGESNVLQPGAFTE